MKIADFDYRRPNGVKYWRALKKTILFDAACKQEDQSHLLFCLNKLKSYVSSKKVCLLTHMS